jgi:hypothetical protein
MLQQIDVVEHSIYGLTGGIHKDYRSDIVAIEPLGQGLRRIHLRLSDDMPKPPGSFRRPTLSVSMIAPESLQNYDGYRRKLWAKIERGEDLTDITLP